MSHPRKEREDGAPSAVALQAWATRQIHEGSAQIMGSRGPNENILVAMEIGTYSVLKATCPWFCRDCFGMTSDEVVADPFIVLVSGQTQLAMKVQFSNGLEGDYTSTSAWTSSNTSVATVSSGLTRGITAGSATAHATTPPLSSNPGQVCGAPPGPCPLTPAQNSSPGTVIPDHLVVVSDVTSVTCTSSSHTLKRQITYSEVDVNGNSVGTIQTKEQFASKGANSCNTTISTSETCSSDSGGQLVDQLFLGCNSVGGSCGTTYTKQQWLYCPTSGTAVVFATPGDVYLHNDSILVGGSAQFATGTKIGPNGVMP